jgi:hypothetical protein
MTNGRVVDVGCLEVAPSWRSRAVGIPGCCVGVCLRECVYVRAFGREWLEVLWAGLCRCVRGGGGGARGCDARCGSSKVCALDPPFANTQEAHCTSNMARRWKETLAGLGNYEDDPLDDNRSCIVMRRRKQPAGTPSQREGKVTVTAYSANVSGRPSNPAAIVHCSTSVISG